MAPPSIPASDIYKEAKILQITPASTNPKLTDDAAAKGNTRRLASLGPPLKGLEIRVVDDDGHVPVFLAAQLDAIAAVGADLQPPRVRQRREDRARPRG